MREVAFAHTPDLDRAPKRPVAGKALAAGNHSIRTDARFLAFSRVSALARRSEPGASARR
jgi:hypothetical protein